MPVPFVTLAIRNVRSAPPPPPKEESPTVIVSPTALFLPPLKLLATAAPVPSTVMSNVPTINSVAILLELPVIAV